MLVRSEGVKLIEAINVFRRILTTWMRSGERPIL